MMVEGSSARIFRLRSHERVSRVTRSALFLAFDLRDPRLHQSLNECGRQRLVRGEVDGPFGCGEALKFVLKRFDNRGRGEQTAVVRKRGEPHQHSFVLERRNSIADGLGSLWWQSGPNRRAKFVQGVAGGFRDACEIFVHVLRDEVAFRARTAITGSRFFHAGNTTRAFASSLPLSLQIDETKGKGATIVESGLEKLLLAPATTRTSC